MSPADPQPLAVPAPSEPLGRRFDPAGAVALAADVLLFNLALLSGIAVMPAQLASFAVATLLGYVVKTRPALTAQGKGASGSLHAALTGASLLALGVRAGVLGLTTGPWGWPAQLAIVAAALAGAGVTRAARDYLLLPTATDRSELLQRLTVFVVACMAVVRLLYACQVQLMPEEAYYWSYWQHPDYGYLDHPPMVAWLIGLGTSLWGDTEIGVRLGALVSHAVACFFVFRLTRNLSGPRSALAALILMQILPVFFFAGVLMTPDAPVIAAWAACLYYLERSLLAGQARAWWGVGVALGLGLMSKYTIGLLVPAALLFMLLDSQARRWLSRWQPYAAGALALAIFSPVILWNFQHHWASFAFQTTRRVAERPRFSLPGLLGSIGVLITPTGLVTVPLMLTRAADAGEDGERRRRFLRVFVLVPLTVFAAFSLRHDVKLDWTGPLWLAAVPGLAHWIVDSARPRTAWLRTGVITMLVYAVGLHYLALGLPGVGYSAHMELLPVGWRRLGLTINELAAQIQREQGSVPLVVGMDRYMLASELAFYAPDHTVSVKETASVHLFGGTGLMYERWFPLDALSGRTLLMVAWKPQQLSSARLAPHVQSLQPIQSLQLTHDGKPIRRLYYRIATGYRPPPDGSALPPEPGAAP